jgi:N,N'-diacetyllegionaminate synthase
MKNKTYIIAEIGINFLGKFSILKKLIISAKKSGADAIKLQLFDPITLSYNNQNIINKNLYKLWKKMHLDLKKAKKIKIFCKNKKIDLYFSIFDDYSLNILKEINHKKVKIASSELNNIELIKKIAKFSNKVILSTGMGSIKEIKKAVNILKKKNLSILHCVSIYPTDIEKCNLNRMISLKKKFKKHKVGFSDHTIGIDASIAAISYGAEVLEKHFTFNKRLIGADHNISADPFDLKFITNFNNNLKKIFGSGKIEPTREEKTNRILFRKGLYSKTNIKKGDKFTEANIYLRRPQNTFPIDNLKIIFRKKSKKKIYPEDSINLSDLV